MTAKWILLCAAWLVVGLAWGTLLGWHIWGGEPATRARVQIDCGPEGKPVLNGTACIDREPYVYP